MPPGMTGATPGEGQFAPAVIYITSVFGRQLAPARRKAPMGSGGLNGRRNLQVAVCRLALHIPEIRSLKGKRQVVKSLCGRLRSRFEVSVAEVGDQDKWQSALIGIAVVSGDARTADAVIERVVEFVEANFFDVQVLAADREVIDLTD